jgi:hypothetical protein
VSIIQMSFAITFGCVAACVVFTGYVLSEQHSLPVGDTDLDCFGARRGRACTVGLLGARIVSANSLSRRAVAGVVCAWCRRAVVQW